MVEVQDGLAFQSKHAPFSNLYPYDIKINDHDYTSVEQGLQYDHAKTCKNDEIAAQILKTHERERVMALAKHLPECEEWNNQEVEVCKKYNIKK